MMSLQNYALGDKLYESQTSLIYKAVRKSDGVPVIAKILKAAALSSDHYSSYSIEFKIASKVPKENFIQYFELIQSEDSLALILEDIGGDSLLNYLKKVGPLPIKSFLNIAIKLVEGIQKMHLANIIHRDINPGNIIYNPKTEEIKISDLGIATNIKTEKMEAQLGENGFVGTLAYISPEQTGRLNRQVDYRTDFYSLGITFYQLLTGEMPFSFTDPGEIIHAHIARIPKSPSEKNPTIPTAISNLILKLIAKNPIDRYQSALGLLIDLEKCKEEYITKGYISEFPLGEKDLPPELKFPEKLYGREKEIENLTNLFNRMADEPSSLILIQGFSGIGKSSLVYALYQNISDKRLNFISGKFDQFMRGVPLKGFSQAFESLVDQLLSETDEKILEIKKNLKIALGNDAQALFETISNLKLLVDPPSTPLPVLEPEQNQIRFFRTFYNFLSVVATNECPIVLFLDDIQWADQASLNLIFDLKVNRKAANLVFIGAYRDNEIDSLHPLTLLMNKIMTEGGKLDFITLKPLAQESTIQLLADLLRRNPSEVESLATLCQLKTEGNPFYLHQFLKFLEQEKILKFDLKSMKWEWDLDEIKNQARTENVIDLLINKMRRLPLDTQIQLQYASCIGNRFNLDFLQHISRLSLSDLSAILRPAIDNELILPIDFNSRRMDNDPVASTSFCFLHDKVQQAAHSEIDKKKEKNVRWTIGTLLFESLPKNELDEHLFEIVEHLNLGKEFANTPELILHLAKLNLQAGVKAKAENAYDLADRYLAQGISLIENIQNQQNLKFSLFYEYGLTKHLNNQSEEGKKILWDLLSIAKDLEEKLKIYKSIIRIETIQANYKKAISIGIEAFQLLGLKIKEKPTAFDIVFELIKCKIALIGKSTDSLFSREEIKDKNVLAKLSLASDLLMPTLFGNDELFALLNFISLNLTLKHGNSQYASSAYLVYGTTLLGFRDLDPKKEKLGCAYGELSLKLLNRYKDFYLRPLNYFLYLMFYLFRKLSFQDCAKKFLEAYSEAVQAGDKSTAISCLTHHFGLLISSGFPLKEILEMIDKASHGVKKLTDVEENLNFWVKRSNCEGLLKGEQEGWTIEGKNDQEILNYIKENKLPRALYNFYISKVHNTFWEENYEKSLEYQKLLIPYIPTVYSKIYMTVIQILYYPLTLSALYDNVSPSEQKYYIKEIKEHIKAFHHRSINCPQNNLNKFYLLTGELYRIKKNYYKAVSYFIQSIQFAQKYKLPHEEALAHELIAKCYFELKDFSASNGHISIAYFLYKTWGLAVKVKLIETRQPEIASKLSVAETKDELRTITSSTQNFDIDLQAILKASQSISEEINPAGLIGKILKIMVVNSGAQRGVILLDKNSKLYIEGCLNVDLETSLILSSTPYENSEIVPSSIIGYVQRTKKQTVINDAKNNNKFSKDPYFIKNQPRSLLCLPIIHLGGVSGILYFENNIVENVFTQNRLDILEALASQVSISMENARLYSTFEHFVPKGFLNLLGKKNIMDIELGDTKEGIFTILFIDIRQFTTLAEQIKSQEIFLLLNQYFSQIEKVIIGSSGFIDKYLGDALLALFPRSAYDAVNAGVEICRIVRELSEQRLAEGLKIINIGIGINTGSIQFGLVGGKERMDVTVIGDTANTAARIENLNRYYGTLMLVSNHTLEALHESSKNFKTRVIDEVLVKGKEKQIVIIEIIDALSKKDQENRLKLIDKFYQARQLYKEGQFSQALEEFISCQKEDPSDILYSIYINRCEQFIEKGVPQNWEGIWRFEHK